MCPSVPFRSELKCTAGNDATDRFFQQIEPYWYDLRGKEAVWSPSLWEVLQKSTGRDTRSGQPPPITLTSYGEAHISHSKSNHDTCKDVTACPDGGSAFCT